MNRNATQAIVAIIATLGLYSLAVVSLVFDLPQKELLIGGCIALTGSAGAWLFRLNGNGK